jgi:hypothetical protein
MKRTRLFAAASIAGVGLAVVVGSIALAEPAKEGTAGKDAKQPGQPEMKLPPGWTEDDMKACMEAGTPGKMHKLLAEGAGEWQGKNTMWMAPGSEPMTSECTSKATMIMDGRFMKLEVTGDMPGMGPFNGLGLYGYDNVTKKFVSTWTDSCGTTMMQGTGDLSEDGKTLNWKFTCSCPIAKKMVVVREVETISGPDRRKLEMFGPDPKSGKEYKTMVIEFTRKKGDAQARS